MALLLINSLIAQPALQWIRPPFGTTKTYTMFSGAIPAPSEGANQTWNYGTYNPSNIFTLQYMDYNLLPASAKNKFPTSTYVEAMPGISLDITIINYYQEYTDSLKRLGQQGSGGNLANTWGDIEAVFNLSYGDSTNSNTKFKYAAYGTLTTKFGTYTNVVLLKRANASFFYLTTPYFAPLMEIVYNGTAIVGAYIFNYGTSDIKEHNTEALKLFPNPVKDHLNINIPANCKGKIITIYDQNAKEVICRTIENTDFSIDFSSFSAGNYFLKYDDKCIKFIKE